MHIQNFIKIHPFDLKILRKNTFLHQSRAISLLFISGLSPFAIPNHSSPISMSMQSSKKNRSKTTQVRVWKRSADGQSPYKPLSTYEAKNLDSLPLKYSAASLIYYVKVTFKWQKFSLTRLATCEICHLNVHPIEDLPLKCPSVRTFVLDRWTDIRKMDRQTLKIFGGYNIIPCHFLCGGV